MQVFVMTSQRSSGDLVEWGFSEEIITELYKDNCRNPDYNDAHLAMFVLTIEPSNDFVLIDKIVKKSIKSPSVQPSLSRSPTDIYA